MHPAKTPDALVPGPQIQVIGVRQNDLCAGSCRAQLLEHALLYRLHRSRRAHWHEHRRLHNTVRQQEPPPATPTRGRPDHLKIITHRRL